MPSFTDTRKRVWNVTLTIGTLRRVQDELDIDLMEIVEPDSELLKRLRKMVLLCDVLYVICMPQAVERSVSDTDFGEAMDGTVLEKGWDAIFDAIVNFSRPEQSKLLGEVKKAVAIHQKHLDGQIGEVVTADKLAANLIQKSDKLLEQLKSGTESTNAPAS